MEANDHNYNSDLDEVIRQVKEEFRSIFAKRRDLIIKLGEAFEHTVSNSESICEEIKNELNDEITQGLISRRDIERYCPEKWKKKTRPKKEENDKLSISSQEQETKPQVMIDTHGNPITETMPIPDPNSNNTDDANHEESAKEEAKYIDDLPAGNELDDSIRKSAKVDQQLLSEDRVKELEAKIERIEIDLQFKSNDNIQLQSQVEELKSKLKARAPNLTQGDRFFDTEFELPFKGLQDRMKTLLSKNNYIKNIPFIVKVDLATKNLTDIRIWKGDGTYDPLN